MPSMLLQLLCLSLQHHYMLSLFLGGTLLPLHRALVQDYRQPEVALMKMLN